MKKFVIPIIILIGAALFFTLRDSSSTKPKPSAVEETTGQDRESRSPTLSRDQLLAQPDGWEKMRKRLQTQLELPQDNVPWDTIGPDIAAMFQQDETKTLRLLTGLTGDVNHFALRLLIDDFYKVHPDPTAALKSLAILQENHTLSTDLVPEFLSRVAKNDRAAAESWLLKNQNMSGIESGAAVIGHLAGQEGDRAASFEKMNGPHVPGNIKGSYLQAFMKSWIETDFQGAVNHLSGTKLTPELDQTVYELIPNLNAVDPAKTMTWAQIISNPGLQRSAILDTAKVWQNQNGEAYQAWKEQAELTEDLRKELP